jgi:hypothetical protein
VCHARLRLHQRIRRPCLKKIRHALAARHLVSERSPTVLAHEVARSQRMADLFEERVSDPLMKAEPAMAHLTVAVSLDMARKRGPR